MPSSSQSPSVARHTHCPRCGYDLAGTVTRWHDSCDLDGTCPECGLTFRWGDVMVPGRSGPRWFYENIHRPAIPTALATSLRIVTPRKFWSSINLAYPINRRRLCLLVGIVVVIIHCLLAAGSALWLKSAIDSITRNPGFQVHPTAEVYLRILAWPYSSHQADFSYTIAYTTGAKTFTAPVHSPRGVRADLLAALVIVGLMPLSYLLLGQTLRRTRVRPIHLFRVAAYSALLLAPIVFLQILAWSEWVNFQQTLSTSRSTFVHLLSRVWMLLPGPFAFFLVELALVGFWWWAATVRYLRLPHALGVVAAMVAITGLSALLLLALTSGWRLFFPI